MNNISSIGIGCHKLKGGFEKKRSYKIISTALDSNINYFDTGDVNVVGNYKDGKLDGEYIYYDKDGKIYWEGIYKDDVLVNETSYIGSKGPFRLN